jgi:Fe-S-cluster containining protein
MGGQSGPRVSSYRDELYALYAEVDAVLSAYTCDCAEAKTLREANCCHFANTGREPFPTAVELEEVRRAVAALGIRRPRAAPVQKRGARALPVVRDPRTCPLLSDAGRCRIYAARPFGCRTFFCDGHEPSRKDRALVADISRRLADLSARAFPRDPRPRGFLRALEDMGR